jgi:carbamoyltransferase
VLTVGLSGVLSDAAAAATGPSGVIGVCPQERVTRTRGAGFNASGLPDEAIDAVMRSGASPSLPIDRYVLAGPALTAAVPVPVESISQHLAHAATAYLSSPFTDATIVVCDRSDPKISVWRGANGSVVPVEWPWSGPAFADLYLRCADILGFKLGSRSQKLEALARLCPNAGDSPVDSLWTADPNHLSCGAGWEQAVADRVDRSGGGPGIASAPLAAALQRSIIRILIDWLTLVKRTVGGRHLCLGGSLFYHSSINSGVRRAALFDDVFVPVDPGVPGLAIGAALYGQHAGRRDVSPFLGPSFSDREAKETLDNCKLHYAWESEQTTIDVTVEALMAGRLVGWFDGAMEWGPRALGARSILASPHAPFVLENLNGFLKHREPWRGYSLSGRTQAIRQHFDGPAESPFMECDFHPKDPDAFRHVLPQPTAALRVQTVDGTAPPRFGRLLDAFGVASGMPILVNTSFNGFQEPIVCSPRDAVRVFYGTGLDLLVVGPFVLRK